MALSEFEIKRIEKLVGELVDRRRPDPTIREQLDIDFRVENQSFELYEIRPVWNDPSQKMEAPVARVTYVKSRAVWKIFWMRSDMRWHAYTPCREAASLEAALDVIDKDEYHCFWG